MAEATVQQPASEEAAVAEIDFYCKEIDRMLAEMKQSQANIDRLHKENKERLSRIEAAAERLSATK